MMIPLQEILTKYNIHPKGVISVGAHWAEEHDEFVRCGIERFIYIEPCKEAFIQMAKNVGRELDIPEVEKHYSWGGGIICGDDKITLIHCACGLEEKEMPMYVSHQNQGQSNSFLKPELHLIQHPEIIFDDAELVKVIPLDNLPIGKEKYDMLVMDTEGYEGEVLKGATETLKNINIIYTEVNRGETRIGNILIEDLDEYLKGYDFKRVETHWPSPNWTWGDALYLKPSNQFTGGLYNFRNGLSNG